jgi:hypothetical protein
MDIDRHNGFFRMTAGWSQLYSVADLGAYSTLDDHVFFKVDKKE